MSPSALRGTLGRAHFSLEDRLSQPDSFFEGFSTVHAEHHDEEVPCEIGYCVETEPNVACLIARRVFIFKTLNVNVTDKCMKYKHTSWTNYIFSRTVYITVFLRHVHQYDFEFSTLSRTSLSNSYYAIWVVIIPNRTEVATRHCIRTNYKGHASHMRDTRMLRIMNIYPDGFISILEELLVYL